MTYLELALRDGHAELRGEGKNEKITYINANHTERYIDPEEKVRAEFWAELIYKYEYLPERMRFEVKVERRTPDDKADIVIYADDELKDRYFVFECKRPDITGAQFEQAVEQACGNRASSLSGMN